MSEKISLVKTIGRIDHLSYVYFDLLSLPKKEDKKTVLSLMLALSVKPEVQEDPRFTHPLVSGKKYIEDIINLCESSESKSALRKIKDYLNHRMYQSKNFSRFEVSICLLAKDMLMVIAGGGGEVSLIREKAAVKLLKSKPEMVISASGKVKEGDCMVVGSSDFFARFSDELIKDDIEKYGVEKTIKEYDLKIRSQAKADITAGGIFSIGVNNEKVSEKIKTRGIFANLNKFLVGVKNIRPANLVSDKKDQKVSNLKVAGNRLSEELDRSLIVIVGFNKKLMFMGLIMIGFLIALAFYGNTKKTQESKNSQLLSGITQIRHKLDQSLELTEVDKKRARELFLESKSEALELKELFPQKKEVDEVLSIIFENEGLVLGEYRKETQMFLDLDLLSEGFKANKMVVSKDTAYIADYSGKKIIKLQTDSKRSEVVVGPTQLVDLDHIASYLDRLFIFNSEGVYELIDNNLKKSGESLSNDVLVAAYAGNIYILDKDQNMIFRLAAIEQGFASPKEWLAEGIDADFEDVLDMVIDGTIWILKSNGAVERYSLGNKVSFSYENISPDLYLSNSLFTDEECDNLYLMDKVNNRLVVFNKEGNFVAQYINEEIGNSDDFVVLEKERRILLLQQQKVLLIEI